MRNWLFAALAALISIGVPTLLDAHEIPSSVTVLAFIKPQGDKLRLIVRVPLEAMRDIKWPVRGPGYLDVDAATPLTRDAAKIWIADNIRIYEEGKPLAEPQIVAARIALPSEKTFTSYDAALSGIGQPHLDPSIDLAWQAAMLDVVLEYPVASAASHFSVEPSLGRLGVRTTTVLHFVTPAGADRVFEYIGDPGLVQLDPRWHQAALRFVRLGFEHIMSGIDHLLFIFCLVIPFRRIRPLVPIITAFTIAHSITLIASAAGFAPSALWFPPLIEVLIALSIVYMALENIVGAKLERRWVVAFGFGLVHGFGFSFALRESLQFAGSHLATSLLSFNVGVELGQLFVLALAVPLLNWVFSHVVAERMGTIILSTFVAHTAWHWMLDRGDALLKYNIEMPTIDAAFAAATLRVIMLALIVGGAAWGMSSFRAQPRSGGVEESP